VWAACGRTALGGGTGALQDRGAGVDDLLVRAQRADVLSTAYAEHPERFVRKPPTPPTLPTAVWITQPKEDTATTQ
jgi:hypothetical protein